MAFSNYLLIELKPRDNPLLKEDPTLEALAIFGKLILENLRVTGSPVLVRIEGMGGAK